jgi:thioesterase domain-containing protein
MQRSGTTAPLYCTHVALGTVFGYSPIAKAFTGLIPVYGVQSRTLVNPAFLDSSIEQMAAHYVDLLCEHNEHGPYFLLGWSFGGILALAMAAIFEERGKIVSFLGLVDPSTPDKISYTQESVIRMYVNDLSSFNDSLSTPQLSSAEFEQLMQISYNFTGKDLVTYVADWGTKCGYWSPVSVDLINILYSVGENLVKIKNQYTLRRIQAPIYVWWAQQTIESNGGTPPVDWSPYSYQTPKLNIIAGDHGSIIRDPDLHTAIKHIILDLPSQ